MTYDPNLPPQLSEDSRFLNEEVRMKICEECEGTGKEEYWEPLKTTLNVSVCLFCSGKGKIHMTNEEILEELENKKEKESGLYNQ